MMGSATESEKASYEIHSDWKAAKTKSAIERTSSLRKLWQSPIQRPAISMNSNSHIHNNTKPLGMKDEFRLPTSTPIPRSISHHPLQMSSDEDGTGKSARKSPRLQQPSEFSTAKRITRSSASPIGVGKTTKRRSSSLRRIYFASPR